MNRRQLIQSLALATTAGTAIAQDQPAHPAPHSPAFKTVELDHISYQAKDYRVTRDFYADLMGMEVTNDDGKCQCELRFGNSMLLARNRRQPAADAPPPAPGRPVVTSLVDHVAYRVYNWETAQVHEELMKRGLAKPELKPDTGGIPSYSSFHVSDPDGFNLQISGWAGAADSVNKKK